MNRLRIPSPESAAAKVTRRRWKADCWLLFAVIVLATFSPSGSAQTPQWIWHPSTNPPSTTAAAQNVFFRRSFRTPPLLWNARLSVSADDSAEVFLNGVSVATCEQWNRPIRAEVSVRLNQGENILALRARNGSGPAGVLVQLGLGGQTNVVSDGSWLVSTNEEAGWTTLGFNAARWGFARELGGYGTEPWGEVLARATATPAESLQVPPGFKVELLRSAEPEEGSWICLAFDERGRLTISPEGDKRPLLRLTFEAGQVKRVEPMAAPVHYAMGLLYAYDGLYANARGPQGPGLYRLVDVNHNDQFDPEETRLLKTFDGGSEHGYHAVRLGPDGRIYVVNGNGTKLPLGLASKSSAHRHYGIDMLSLNPDETQAKNADAAVQCYIVRTDPEGHAWDLWAGGMRNAYSFDFSPDGELFTFDSDMEWDWGTPWYRPTRILHVIAGAEFGWRDGTPTWPEEYEDSMPAVVNVGIGSPTGVRFAAKSRFPEPYRRALFAMDWSYGRILAVQLNPQGASYSGRFETFLKGAPLNLTDLDFGPDGALYFVTGGRATQSGLYRVTYTGEVAPGQPSVNPNEPDAVEARVLRRQLEPVPTPQNPPDLELIWRQLGSRDRVLRYAARVALEYQDVSLWRERALEETNQLTGLTALLGLARVGEPSDHAELRKALGRWPLEDLSDTEKLLALRVLEVSIVRGTTGADSGGLGEWTARLDHEYPAKSWLLNRELSRLLIYLGAPGVVPKTLELLAVAPTQEEQLHYVAQLRNLRTGWTLPERRRYFEWWLKSRERVQRPPDLLRWFADVGRSYVDGAWVDRYLREFRVDAVANLTAEERTNLVALLQMPFQKARQIPSTTRAFVQTWTMADLVPDLPRATSGRDFKRGRQAFVDAQCLACHRFGNDGGNVGPELTGAGSKYDLRSLLESMLEPSKVVAEQYQNTTVFTRAGDSVTGRVIRDSPDEVVVETDPLSGTRETVARAEVQSMGPSALSPMPEGLANVLTREEILDLLAYLQSGGSAEASAFRRP